MKKQVSPKFRRALEAEVRRLMEARNHWISASTVYRKTLGGALEEALRSGRIRPNYEVYMGPSGDAVVVRNIADLEDRFMDYNEEGTVAQLLR